MKLNIILIVISTVLLIDGVINIVMEISMLVAAIDFVVGLPLLWWSINRMEKAKKARRTKIES